MVVKNATPSSPPSVLSGPLHSPTPSQDRRMRIAIALCLSHLLLISFPDSFLAAKESNELSLQRIYRSGEFGEKSVHAEWWEAVDQQVAAYTVLESPENKDEGREIVRYEAESGERSVLVTAAELTPPGKSTPLSVDDYSWSADQSRLLIFTDSKRVWRQKTKGDYWVLDRPTGQLFQLGDKLKSRSMMYATFSPDGNSIAYVSEGNLFVEELLDRTVRTLAKRENERVFNGMTDWVYEEEFGLRDAFRWSPDGKRIAYWRFDTSGVKDFSLINNTDSLYPKIKTFAYPKAGTRNSDVRIAVVDVATGATSLVQMPGNPRQTYLPAMQWIDATGELVIRQLNRLQNRETFTVVNFETQTKREIFSESDDAWIDLQPDVTFLNQGDAFLYLSDRDGWRHLYRVGVGNSQVTELTQGDFDVIELVTTVRPDASNTVTYFIASPESATERYLYAYSFSDQKTRRITPAGLTGSHRYQISPNGAFAIHRFSSVDRPPVTELVSLPDHRVIRVLESNDKLVETLDHLKPVTIEFLQVDLENTKLDAWAMMPSEMEANKTYPLLVYVYGEPAGTTVVNRWLGKTGLWHRLLAERGYVVVSIDNRGTNAPRGREFRKSVYRQLGILGPNDQAAAVHELLDQRPYLDPKRVGVWGWSGGGTSTLHALFRYPKLYRTGVSIAPVANLSYYDTIYEERYMGLPNDNVEGYRGGSPINFVDQFQGDLLLIHGTADDNVHYQATELLINKLVEAGKQFDLFVYPGRSHSISEGKHTRLHLMTMVTDFLLEHLPAGPQDSRNGDGLLTP